MFFSVVLLNLPFQFHVALLHSGSGWFGVLLLIGWIFPAFEFERVYFLPDMKIKCLFEKFFENAPVVPESISFKNNFIS